MVAFEARPCLSFLFAAFSEQKGLLMREQSDARKGLLAEREEEGKNTSATIPAARIWPTYWQSRSSENKAAVPCCRIQLNDLVGDV